ncbi:MAG: ATP-binding protein [Pseudomonadota bacterium]
MLEDDPMDEELARCEFSKAGVALNARRVDTRADFVVALEDFRPDIVLADYKLPCFDGMEALGIARELAPEVPFIFVSGAMGEEFAIEMLHRGAADYVLKQHLSKLIPAVNRALVSAEEHHRRRDAEENLRTLNQQLERRVEKRTADLSAANAALMAEKARQQVLIEKLEQVQTQLLQSEKMAAIGQLAAGVAHEINNPIGFVTSNLGTLTTYIGKLLKVLSAYEAQEAQLLEAQRNDLAALKAQEDIAYLREDVGSLLKESKDGLQRVRCIVADLKDFAHIDATEWQTADIEQGLDSTLNVVWNELRYKADVIKEYGHPPAVECLPSQLNQVFMSLLVNAAQAIETRGIITIRTSTRDDQISVEIADTGKGITPESRSRIFEPFYTTKPVGKGTGLGLSLSYGIVCKHHGHIEVESEVGKGSVFRVCLPARQPAEA